MAANTTIDLVAEGGVIRLCIDARNWCRVKLVLNEGSVELGADTTDIVASRLLNGLCDALPNTKQYDLDGAIGHWLLTLSEKHSAMFAGGTHEKRILFFVGAREDTLRLSVSRTERQRWIALLRILMPSRQRERSSEQTDTVLLSEHVKWTSIVNLPVAEAISSFQQTRYVRQPPDDSES